MTLEELEAHVQALLGPTPGEPEDDPPTLAEVLLHCLLSNLVALHVLATADAVAKVFQQRTGDLVRPLPWPISGPLALGLTLCAAGVILAGSGVLPPR